MPEHTPAPTPSRGVYGFALYIGVNLCFFLYLVWAIVPEDIFKEVGITYLPGRSWAVSIPVLLLNTFALAFLIYASLNLQITPDFNEIRTIRDDEGKRGGAKKLRELDIGESGHNGCTCKNKRKCVRDTFQNLGTCVPSVADLDIRDVNKMLYLE